MANQVTLLDELLRQIIKASHDGAVEMDGLNKQVAGAAAGIRRDNISDSGSIIVQRLNLWESEWMAVKNKLDSLNTRVTDMRTSLINGLQAAVDNAQAGR